LINFAVALRDEATTFSPAAIGATITLEASCRRDGSRRFTQAYCAPALLDHVRRFQDFRTRLEATGVFLATFVTVDLGGYNQRRQEQHPSHRPRRESDLWMEMLNGSLSHGGGRRIPGVDLGDRNIPALKAATVEDGTLDDFFRPALQAAQDRARLDP
jgi:hypothetical protein